MTSYVMVVVPIGNAEPEGNPAIRFVIDPGQLSEGCAQLSFVTKPLVRIKHNVPYVILNGAKRSEESLRIWF